MTQAAPLDPDQNAPRLTGTQWLICVIAAIGFWRTKQLENVR